MLKKRYKQIFLKNLRQYLYIIRGAVQMQHYLNPFYPLFPFLMYVHWFSYLIKCIRLTNDQSLTIFRTQQLFDLGSQRDI